MSLQLPLSDRLATALSGAAAAASLYVVGGFVRDMLLGRPAPDLDLAVSDDAAGVARRLARALGGSAFPLNAEYGVWRVTLPTAVDGVDQIDVAPLRGPVTDDLRLRDFTINAMAWDVAADALIDPLAGQDDLRAGALRLVADTACADDPIRGLRAVRFATELGFTITPSTAAIIRRDAALLARTAGERQRDEFARLFEAPGTAGALRLADDLGLLLTLVPELAASKGCEQPFAHHYYDVFNHTLAVVEVLDHLLDPTTPTDRWHWRHRLLWDNLPTAADVRARLDSASGEERTYGGLLKLCGLLHDVSKPETRQPQPDGSIRFFGHCELGADRTTAILERLRYTTREIRLADLLVREHLRPGQLSDGHQPPTRRALFRFFRDLRDAAPDLLLLFLADGAGARGPRQTDAEWRRVVGYVCWIMRQATEDTELVRPTRLLTGNDVMQELGVAPGPLLGRLLDAVVEAQAEGRARSRDEALVVARAALAAET